jgi:oligopeptide/dipeptide ABC transporter ATP-binding protein
VMYGGRVIERGPVNEILTRPLHPYTRLLISCRKVGREVPLPELFIDSQDLINLPDGCSFHPFCPETKAVCLKEAPGESRSGAVTVACHRYGNEVIPC